MKLLTRRAHGRAAAASALGAFALLVTTAQATHWPQLGGDSGHSGYQAADPAGLPMKFRWQASSPGGDDVATSPLVTGGGDFTAQRVAYGRYARESAGTDLNARLRGRRFSDGASQYDVDLDDEQPRNPPATGTSDDDAFGPDGGVTPVEASSHSSGATQLYVVYNDDNRQSVVNTTPPTPSTPGYGGDLVLAQIDAGTGAVSQNLPIGGGLPGQFSTDGYTIESSPVIGPDDGTGARTIYFVARKSDTDKRLFALKVANAAVSTVGSTSPNALTLRVSPAIADLNTKASPAIVSLYRSTGQRVTMIAMPTLDGLRTIRESDPQLAEAGPSIDALGATWTPSVPVLSNGNAPSQTPFLYVASSTGSGTVVHRLTQDDGDLNDPSALGTFLDTASPELSGMPGRGLAVSQIASGTGHGVASHGRVIVTTSANLFSLDTANIGRTDPPQLFPQDAEAGSGFARTAPSASGELGFAATDAGQQYVFHLAPAAGEPMRVPLDATGFEPADQSLNSKRSAGQPAISRGRVVFGSDNGPFVYGPSVTVTSPPANTAVSGASVKLEAYVYDPALTTVTFTIDGATVASNVPVDPGMRTASTLWSSLTVLDGPHVLVAEATDGTTIEASAQRRVVVNNYANPTAALTVSPAIGNVGQAIALDASGSAPTTSEAGETITRWAFEIDGDNDYDDVVERSADGGDGVVGATFATPGTRAVAVRVTDSHGDTATKGATVSINTPPAAALTATPNPASAGQTVTLDASASSDADGTIARYEFDLDGNGSYETDNGSSPRLAKAFAATTNVGLRVTDDRAGHGTTQTTVTVTGGQGAAKPPTSPGTTPAGACAASSRCRPGIRASVSPKRDRTAPFAFAVRGRLTLPKGVRSADGCTGRVLIAVKDAATGRTLASKRVAVASGCRFAGKVAFRDRARLGSARALRITVKFEGNNVLGPRSAKAMRVRLG